MTRAVITGIGIVAPGGVGTELFWASLRAGEMQVRPVDRFDARSYGTTLAGQVDDFDPAEHVDPRLLIQTDRWTWLSLAALQLALDDGQYDPAERPSPYATSVALSAGSGGNEFGQREIESLWSQGPKTVTAYQSIAWFYAASTGQASIRHGTKGPATVLVSEGAGGLDSVGYARRIIRRGTTAVLAGGTEAPLSPYALACQSTSGRMTTAADPRNGYKPFDRRANGYAPGEGGAVLLVEDLDAARERGAPQVYGEIRGYAATHDAHHHQDPAPDAQQYARAMQGALDDAGVTPDDVDLVIADGAGTRDLDDLEVAALTSVFGSRAAPVPVTAPHGFVGRLNAGGSALNVATALLAMRDSITPAIGNLDEPISTPGLDLVTESRELPVETVLVNARGFGGFNSCMVLQRYREE
ncbi:MAG TPA: beta-ketoacyl synthase N-terminal-like domain-containing protein [Actinomycetes bacterium]|nr:beta-ketoacyl synthase N-terminal-like domain-containing protein [Actinomycetes bacterium]